MKVLALLAVLAAATCEQQPVPWSPDASAPPYPNPAPGSCEAACNALYAAHCKQGDVSTCLPAMTRLDKDGTYAEPSGKRLTCADVSTVTSPAAAKALGIDCAP